MVASVNGARDAPFCSRVYSFYVFCGKFICSIFICQSSLNASEKNAGFELGMVGWKKSLCIASLQTALSEQVCKREVSIL